jgi:hypothetical protein
MESFQSRALAVGQFASAITLSDRLSPYLSPFGPIRSLPSLGRPAWQSFVRAVGQDKDPLPLVRRADFSRAEYSPRRCVTNLFQLSNDFSESEADVSFDIFKEAELGSQNPNSVCDKWPEVARVVCAEALSGCAEGLAWIAPSEDVHAVTKCSPWEGFKIRPDRCCVHESRLHFCDQVRAGEGFDLTKSD